MKQPKDSKLAKYLKEKLPLFQLSPSRKRHLKLVALVMVSLTVFLPFQNCAQKSFTSGNISGGSNATNGSSSPTQASGLIAQQISVGNGYACAVTNQDLAYCWGANATGQLGNGSTTNSLVPTQVSNLSSVTQISTGEFSTCALSEGLVYCWGAQKLGISSGSNLLVPVLYEMQNLTGITQISMGAQLVCALNNQGLVFCWSGSLGTNDWGALGNGSTVDSLTPVQVSNLTGVTQISSGSFGACAVTNQGLAYCWGYNAEGELGNNSTTSSSVPVQVPGLSQVTQISSQGNTVCAVANGGLAYCWGQGNYGQLGNGSTAWDSLVPIEVSGLTGVTHVSTDGYASCAVTNQGIAYCWGHNFKGELGNNSTIDSSIPVQVSGLSGVSQISNSGSGCALTTQGFVYCWGGQNESGEFGNGTTTPSLVPVLVK